MRNNKGITLIELIVVISIISIVLLIPRFKRDNLLNYKERKELMEFKNDINYARNKAVIESTEYSVTIKDSSNSYIIYKQKNVNRIVKTNTFKDGIELCKTEVGEETIKFYPSGAPDIGTTIKLKNRKGKIIKLSITPAVGKVNIDFD